MELGTLDGALLSLAMRARSGGAMMMVVSNCSMNDNFRFNRNKMTVTSLVLKVILCRDSWWLGEAGTVYRNGRYLTSVRHPSDCYEYNTKARH